MSGFHLLSSDHFHVILHPDKKHGLIINRIDQSISTINYDDAKELCNLSRRGHFYGIVGKFLGKYLVLIKDRSYVGQLYEPATRTEHHIYVIAQVQVIDIPLNSTNGDQINPADTDTNHGQTNDDELQGKNLPNDNSDDSADQNSSDYFASLPVSMNTNSYSSSCRNPAWNPFNRISNQFKSRINSTFYNNNSNNNNHEQAVDNALGGAQSNEPSLTSQDNNSSGIQNSAAQEDADKRLTDEMVKLFNGTNSFYFSPTLDLTNRFSRKKRLVKKEPSDSIWKTADERFFWNRFMSEDLIELSERDQDANCFISIILQGFISIEQVEIPSIINNNQIGEGGIEAGQLATTVNFNATASRNGANDCDQILLGEKMIGDPFGEDKILENSKSRVHQLALISRRSVLQAGTRYRRRGCDTNGNCANLVETEQIFRSGHHFNSVILLRGSIPLFWHQSGMNYRPPPVLSRSDEENQQAFSKHFSNLMKTYETNQVIAIDCTEHSGREKAIHDAFRRHMDRFRESYPNVQLIEFDFHRHCRRRQCNDSQVERHLKNCGLSDKLLQSTKYYWNDGEVVWEQDGLFRVNCLDCTDRTNVVQRCVALQVLDYQLARLGIIPPETSFEDNDYRNIMKQMWSSNGNVLSTQYCGTRALFTGDKKLSGLIQDTYSSASRYYISKFRDSYRQAAIDAMLGVETPPFSPASGQSINGNYSDPSSSSGMQKSPSLPFDRLDFMEPLMASSRAAGGALLKDVGNRVSNRLARLRGKLNHHLGANGNSGSSMNSHANQADYNGEAAAANEWGVVNLSRIARNSDGTIDEHASEAMEAKISSSLAQMDIDWPSSSEDITSDCGVQNAKSKSAQIATSRRHSKSQFDNHNDEDNYHDDDFSQLMLSDDRPASISKQQDTATSEPTRKQNYELDNINRNSDDKSISINNKQATKDITNSDVLASTSSEATTPKQQKLQSPDRLQEESEQIHLMESHGIMNQRDKKSASDNNKKSASDSSSNNNNNNSDKTPDSGGRKRNRGGKRGDSSQLTNTTST